MAGKYLFYRGSKMNKNTRFITILSSETLNLEVQQNFQVYTYRSLLTGKIEELLEPDVNYNNLIIKYLDSNKKLTLKEFRDHIQICAISSNKKLSRPAKSFIWKNKYLCGLK